MSTLSVSNITGLTSLTVDDLNVDSNTFYVDSTNNRVGIGTGSPTVTLDVDGAASVLGAATFSNTVSVTGDLTVSSGLNANGSLGTDGQVLTSNGSVVYWASGGSAWTELGTHTFSSAETSYAVSSIPIEYTKILIIITDLEGANAVADSRARMKISGDNGTTTYASGDISSGVRPGDYSSSVFEMILSKYSASNPYIATVYNTTYSEDDSGGGSGTAQADRTNIGGALNYVEVFDNNSQGFNGGTVTIYGMAV